ncbi:MAG: PAS domain S-box protein [Verrucomicrobiia bacterium]|jgi:PAS domain S-box-containing protein
MRLFQNLPIKWKLLLVMVLTSVIAAALLSSALFFTGLIRLRHLAVGETTGLAAIIGGECAGALAAGDANAAQKKLGDLAARTTIEEASLYTADGRECARYTRHDLTPRQSPPARESGECFAGDHLELCRPIEHGGKPAGMIRLRTDTHTQWAQIKSFVGASVVATAILALAMLALASWLERFLFSSIRELVRVARGVTERKDFTLRAAKLGEDETGVLTDAFNKMLGIIQERDSDSRASQNRLEKGVQERTRELEAANEQLKVEIMERKRAEEALRRLAQFPAENPNPVLRIAADGALLYANAPAQAWLAALGSGAGQPLPAVVRALAADARRQGRVVESEITDGSSRVFWFAAIKPPGEDYVNLYGRNITERKQAEATLAQLNVELEARIQQRTAVLVAENTERKRTEVALRESEKKHRRLVETLQEGIWVIDKDSCTTFTNPHMADMLGYTVKEMQGRNLFSFMDERGADIAKRLLERRAQGIKEQHDFEFLKKDGRRLYATLEAGPLTDEAGNYIGAIAGVVDITKRKQAEEKLRRYAEQLQTLSRSLVEAQETERRRIAQELHDEIGQTLMLLKLSLDTAVDVSPEQARERLQDASRRTHELIAAVRSLSLELRPSMLDDVGLLPALLWLGDRFAGQTQVHIEHSGVEDRRFSPEVEIAAYRIAQEALANVVRHAATAQATVRLRADAAMLEVEVEDGGCGFDAAAALAKSNSIGLHGMRERAAALDGELTIKSTPGAGTCVTARLSLGRVTGDG